MIPNYEIVVIPGDRLGFDYRFTNPSEIELAAYVVERQARDELRRQVMAYADGSLQVTFSARAHIIGFPKPRGVEYSDEEWTDMVVPNRGDLRVVRRLGNA